MKKLLPCIILAFLIYPGMVISADEIVVGDYGMLAKKNITPPSRERAEQGDPESQVWMGDRYNRGTGVAQDYAEAARWYRLAAEQGHAPAQFALGHLYREGKGVTQNLVESEKWLGLASAQGYPYPD